MQELVLGTSENFVNNCGFQVYEHCLGPMLANLIEEGVEGIISSLDGLVVGHPAWRPKSSPMGIADLDTSLVNIDGDVLIHSSYRFRGAGDKHTLGYSYHPQQPKRQGK